MNVSNPPKLVGIIVAMLIVGGLLALGSISETAGVGMLSALVFYLIGNGTTKRGHISQPVLTRSPKEDK